MSAPRTCTTAELLAAIEGCRAESQRLAEAAGQDLDLLRALRRLERLGLIGQTLTQEGWRAARAGQEDAP